MNSNDINEKITTIAKFVGLNPIPCGTVAIGKIKHPDVSIAFLNYHENWELLIGVVEAIEKLSDDIVEKVYISINGCSCQIWTYFDVNEVLRSNTSSGNFKIKILGETKKSATFDAVHDFVIWYNSKKTKQWH